MKKHLFSALLCAVLLVIIAVPAAASGGTQSVFSGKGYGALEGTIIRGTIDNGYLSGEIIGLP